MRTFCTRFVPTAAVLAVAMLFGAPSFAQTGGASNAIPNAGSKQDPPVDKPPVVKVTKEEKLAARAKRKAEVTAAGGASNAIPNAGAKQDPQVDKPSAVMKATKEEKLARAPNATPRLQRAALRATRKIRPATRRATPPSMWKLLQHQPPRTDRFQEEEPAQK
ncbi:hypothetical protein LP414_15940 [Polaromonas sp. P1(28)-13]|nr:hypothetical protein LP414_15940 [Polaromonas sp. P1(28)-13]